MKLRLATRDSMLALWQAAAVSNLLQAAWSGIEVELVPVKTSGDRHTEVELTRFGRIGIFTVEVDRAVLDGRADAAVHSLKDMTTTPHEGTVLAATIGRGPVEDVLVTCSGATLAQLPAGAKVGTGSLRRAAMARALRADLEVVGIRGNVQTRLRKLREGEADALIMARAGLERLGIAEDVSEVLDVQRFLPAVGQGIVGVTCRADDEPSRARLAAIRDLESWDEATAERAFLAKLRGGCNVPAGGHARAVEGVLALRGRVLAVDGSRAVEGRVSGPRERARELGEQLAGDLLELGAGALIEAAREAQSE